MEFLVQHGADVQITHASGGKGYNVSLLSLAAHQDSPRVTEMLLKHGTQSPQSGAIQVAAECGFINVLETLVSYGADVNERLSVENIYKGHKELLASRSPLHFAAAEDQIAAVVWLLKHNADPDLTDLCGQTPQGLALSKGFMWPENSPKTS